MLRVILVDDEPLALQNLQHKLFEFTDIQIVQSFTSVKKLLEQIQQIDFHIIFLDIEMPEISGIELAKILKNKKAFFHIVFTTAYREYAIDAFEVNSIDYLLKPISKSRLAITIQRIRNSLKLHTNQSSDELIQNVPLKIECFGSFNVYYNEEIFHWRTSKMRELFAFLLFQKSTPIHRDVILETLWGNDDYQKARIKLHTTLSYLRKAFSDIGFPNIISTTNVSYFLNLSQYHCDAKELNEFVEAAVQINEQSITKAEEIFFSYKGGYMQQNDYEWSRGKAKDLHNQLLLLGKNMIEYYSNAYVLLKKERTLLALHELEPYDETFVQQLLYHFIETGNRLSAIDIYTRYETRLLHELGLPISPVMEKIYKSYYH